MFRNKTATYGVAAPSLRVVLCHGGQGKEYGYSKNCGE
jgi:hypothetical protein